MLVLTRKPGETVVIDDEIVITVLRVQGKSISLGVEAPDSMRIYRGELVLSEEEDEAKQPVEV